jgi:hypothetical protein
LGSIERPIGEEVEIDRWPVAEVEGNGGPSVQDQSVLASRSKFRPEPPLRHWKDVEARDKDASHGSLRAGNGGTRPGSAMPSR